MKQDITNFLIGINRIFVLTRFKIKEPYIIPLMNVILKFTINVMEEKTVSFITFSEEILNIKELDEYSKELLITALNTDSGPETTDNPNEMLKYLQIIIYSIHQIIDNLKTNNYEKSYDLVDTIHCLPEMLLNDKKWNPKGYWESFVIPYRLKWDKDFLTSIEKDIVAGFN